jgi:hypothetical protein
MSVALAYSASSDQPGWSDFRRSQIALCSRVKSACNVLRPIHQLSVTPAISIPVASSTNERPSSRIRSLPSWKVRSLEAISTFAP